MSDVCTLFSSCVFVCVCVCVCVCVSVCVCVCVCGVQIVSSLQCPEPTARCLKVSAACGGDPYHTPDSDTRLVLHPAVFLKAKLALAQEDPSTALQVLREGECGGAEENCLMGVALWLRGEAGDRREAYRHFVKVRQLKTSPPGGVGGSDCAILASPSPPAGSFGGPFQLGALLLHRPVPGV